MKKVTLFILALFAIVQLQAQNGVAISTLSTATPDASAILDVQSTDQGILIPRVDIADLSTPAPMTAVVTSLLVYNTNTTTGPGFFYWDSKWHSLASSNNPNTVSIDSLTNGYTHLSSMYLGDNAGNAANASTGSKNTGIGTSALSALTTGNTNTAIGALAGYNTTTGFSNILIGFSAIASSATASHELNIGNLIYGQDVNKNSGTTPPRIGIGSYIDAIDASAVLQITSTEAGILIPRMTVAQRNLISSPATSLMIYQTDNNPGFYFYNGSLWHSLASSNNPNTVSIDSLTDGYTYSTSMYLGDNAGNASTGSKNTGIGTGVLSALTTGNTNTAIGELAGWTTTTGFSNILIGFKAVASSAGASHELNIGNLIFGQDVDGGATTSPRIGIGSYINAIDASAVLQITSTKAGILIPRMTVAQRNAISSPATSLMIYQTDNNPGFYFYNGSAWASIGGTVIHLTPISTAPANPTEGDMYMNSSTHKLMVYDGTIWQACW